MCRSRTGSGAAASSRTTGVLDFAGGLVVHLTAGVGGLVAAMVIGQRHGYGTENLAPFDLSLAVIGTGMLWVGWFGFNGGSALGANPRAVMAITATHLAACAGALTWMRASNGATRAQAVGARHDLRRGRGPRHHHAGLRISSRRGTASSSASSPARSASGPAPGSSSASATTIRSTCSASTASAA